MHSYVIQISRHSIPGVCFLNANGLVSLRSRFFDYCYNLSSDFRIEVIRRFVHDCLPEGMFTFVGNDKIRYNGGISLWFEQWAFKIHAGSAVITPDTLMQSHEASSHLKEIIENPLEGEFRFYMPDDFEADLCYTSAGFMHLVSGLREGDCLYFGAVLGYHF